MPVYGTKSPTPALANATGGSSLNPFVHPATKVSAGMHQQRVNNYRNKGLSYKVTNFYPSHSIESANIAFMYLTP
jgi:hypothetical protein